MFHFCNLLIILANSFRTFWLPFCLERLCRAIRLKLFLRFCCSKISLTTFRHWGATMTYHYTRNILLVKELLGHKRIENTMKYTQLVHFKDDEFDVATATNLEEAKQLLEAGFDYITEMEGYRLFRRPKRFSA